MVWGLLPELAILQRCSLLPHGLVSHYALAGSACTHRSSLPSVVALRSAVLPVAVAARAHACIRPSWATVRTHCNASCLLALTGPVQLPSWPWSPFVTWPSAVLVTSSMLSHFVDASLHRMRPEDITFVVCLVVSYEQQALAATLVSHCTLLY